VEEVVALEVLVLLEHYLTLMMDLEVKAVTPYQIVLQDQL
jgi:hypothetical protein